MNVEQFIEAIIAKHTKVRREQEERRMEAYGPVYGPADLVANNDAKRDVLYLEGVLNGIEETAELILGREKMEEIFGIEPPDANLVLA